MALPSGSPRGRIDYHGSFWRFQIAGWIAFWVAMASSRVGRFPLGYMLVSKGVLTLLGFAITSLVLRPVYRRLLRRDPSLMRIILVTVASSYFAAALWTIGDNVTDIPIAAALLDRTIRITSVGQLLGGALYNAFALLAWSVLYVGAKHYHQLRDERERTLRAESLAHQARLEALRYQLNPHFLFNALNAISTLVVDRRNDEAGRMLARLGDLLRATLDRAEGDAVSLADEIELVRRYLDIEQIRLGDRLTVDVDISAESWSARVPSLILQPLVENAIRHGIAPREQGGRITITAEREKDRLVLAVTDDGPGLRSREPRIDTSGGIGLTNTRERLQQLYGDAQEFAIGESETGGMRVRVALPFTPNGGPPSRPVGKSRRDMVGTP